MFGKESYALAKIILRSKIKHETRMKLAETRMKLAENDAQNIIVEETWYKEVTGKCYGNFSTFVIVLKNKMISL